MTGGGYEYEYVYANTKFKFLDIGNIHVMRKRSEVKVNALLVIPYSELFPWGANFRYFRG